MELELGLKITKTRDDISSISEYQLAKDKGPIFQSRETNTTFILTAHLKGYKRNNIDIKISKDGNKITISGEKPIQEMVMIGWVMHKKVVDVTGFNKVFKIPNGVNLDRIKAKYDEDEWILSIVMPKLVKGICGQRIEEVKEEEFDKRISEKEKSKTYHVSSSVGETSQRGSKDNVEDMESSENIMQNMVDDANKEMNEERIKKDVGESNFDIGDGNGEGMREKVGEEDKMVSVSILDDANGKIIGETIQKEVAKSMLRNEEGEDESVRKNAAKERSETEDGVEENMKESSIEPFEPMKLSELDDPSVIDKIPSNIGDMRQRELEDSRIQQKEKIKSTKVKIDGGQYENIPNQANKDVEKAILGDIIQKDNIKPNTETDNEDQECVREKLGKEGSVANVGIREKFPKHFPKTTLEENEELNVQKMQEMKDVKEEMIKRKGKEIEHFVEKGERETQKTMHVDENNVGEFKIGLGDGNGKGVRKEVGKELYEVMKSPEQEKNVGVCISKRIDDTRSKDKEFEVQQLESRSVEKNEGGVSDEMPDVANKDIEGGTVEKAKEESKLRIEDDKLRESVVEEKTMVSVSMLDDANGKIIGDMIQREVEKSMLRTEEGEEEILKEEVAKEGCAAQNTGVTRQGVSEECLTQQSGDSKQKAFGESKCETEDTVKENMKESSKEPSEAMKISELDCQDVVGHIPSNSGEIRQKELKESRIKQMEKTKCTKEKNDGGKYGKTPAEANKDVEKNIFGDIIQKDIIKPKIETENEDQECATENPDKEGSDAMAAIREEFPKHFPKTTHEAAEEKNVQRMQEIKDVKEEMIKRKGNEIEYSVEKGEGERNKTMHADANKGITRETVEEEIEKKKNGVDESGHVRDNTVPKSMTEELPKQLVELDGSKGFKVAEEEDQKEMIKEEKVETESLMNKEEGEYSNKRNHEADKVLDDADKDMSEGRIKNKVGEFSIGIGDGNGKGVRKKVGKEEHEVIKTLEQEKKVGVFIPQRIEDTTSQDKKSEVHKMDSAEKEGRVLDVTDDGNGDQTGSTIKKGREESMLRNENEEVKGMREKISKAAFEAMKTSEIKQDVGAGFPQNNGDISQDYKEPEDEEIEEKVSIVEKEKMESDNMLDDTNEEITEEIEKSMLGIEEGGRKSVKEKVGNKGCEQMKSSEHEEGVHEVPNSITEELPKQLEELDGSKELKSAKEEEQKEVNEEATPETEILMEEMEEDSKKRNEEASRDTEKSTVIETLLKKTEDSNIEKKSSDGQVVHEKLPRQVVEAISQNEKNKTEHDIVKLKEKGSINMHDEPNEAFENDTTENRIEKEIRKQKLESGDQLNLEENVDNGIIDGRKRQKFPGMEEVENAKEDGAKYEGYVKKVTGDIYEKIHVEANEDLKKDITKGTRGEEIKDPKIQTKEKGEHHLHEEMSKQRSQESKAAKELNIREKFPKHLPKTTLESEELSVQKMQEIKDVKEEMIKRKGKVTEHFVEKGEGERHKTMHEGANKGITRETIEDDIEKRKNAIEESGQQHVEKNTVKGRFELPKSITEELPKKLVELDGSKGFEVAEEEEQQEVIKAKNDKTECFMEKEEGKESKKINEVVDKVLDDANKEIREKRTKKEVGESKKGIGDGYGKGVRKKVGKEEHEEMMDTLELEKIVGVCIPQRIEDTTSKDKKSEVKNIDSRSVEKKDGKEEFPKHLPKATLEESELLNVQKKQEIKDVKEEMIKRKGEEIEYSEEKADGEKHKTIMHVEKNKGTTRETMQENIEKKKNGVDESGQHVGENIVKGVFEVPKSITKELDGSKEVKVAKEAEQKEVTKEAMNETEILMEKKEGGESNKRNEEASSGTEKSRVIETLLKKPEESTIEKKSSDRPFIKEKLPKKVVEEIAEAEKDKTEHGIVKLKGKGSIKMHVEPNEAFENDTAGNKIEKDARKQKHESSDQSTMKEIVNNEIFDGMKRQNFPEMEDENAKEDDAKIERSVKKVNGDKYEKIQVEVNEDFKEEITKETKGKDIEDPKIQTKEKGEHHLHEEMSKEISQESKSARNDPFKDTVQKEKEEPKILNKVKDQQCLQEDMSKGRYEASTKAREFPMQIVDSLAKTRERPKNKETEEAEEAKGDLAKRKSGELKFVESRTKEKFQGTESEKTTQILHEAPEEKHPKTFEIGTPERKLQSERGHTTSAKVVNMGLKETEQGTAKDKKQKTRLLPPKTPSKETHGSENEGVNQHDFKPKQTKEEGEQHNYNTEDTKEVAAKEDQEIKPSSSPRFPSTQQSEVKEKDKFYEGGKAKYEASRESQKKDLTKDMQNLIEMKENQEGKQKEALKPEIPLEKHPKKGEQVIRRGEFHKGKNVGETMQEKTDGPKKKIDVRNQQYVVIDVGKVESIEEEMSKEYKADAGSIAERMETKKGLKTTHEREDDMPTENVDDEKPKTQDEIIKADIEKVNKDKCILESMKTTQEKEHPIKSEAVEKETESLEATSSLPNVTSMGIKEESQKKEVEDLHQKELSPLKADMKSKEPLELEKPVIQWKLPKTKEHVPLTELRDKEQHSYFTEEIEDQKITAYEGAKPSKFQRQIITQQSTDEENRKSENDVEEHKASKDSPKINIMKNEQIDSFQPHGNEYYEKHKFDEQDEALDRCEYQGQKILNEDRGQQHVQDNIDNKGSQTPKDVEEEMFMKEREGSKVAKSAEAKDSSRNKRERGKTTHFPEAEKPKMKEKTSHFEKASGSKQVADKMHETGDREHQIDSEEVTSNTKVRVEPPTMIEKPPYKEVERKEPHEITWPNMDYETPQISEVQEEKDGERQVHALKENISKEELAQATATHSNTKSEVEPKGDNGIGKPLPSPSIEILSKEPQESEECSMKECDSKGENIVQVSEKKEPIHSTEGTTASEEVPVKEESQEAKKKDSKTDVQEPNKGKRDQQCINKDEEEKYGINEIEEEKASEEGLEEQKEYKEEASGGKKDDTTMPKKLFVPLAIAGSVLLGGIFVWHRRTRKR